MFEPPQKTSRPSGRERARSPVRYIRARAPEKGPSRTSRRSAPDTSDTPEPVHPPDKQLARHPIGTGSPCVDPARTTAYLRSAGRWRPDLLRARPCRSPTRSSSPSGRTCSRAIAAAEPAVRQIARSTPHPRKAPSGSDRPVHPASSSSLQVVGVACITVIPAVRTAPKRRAIRAASRPAIATPRPPQVAAQFQPCDVERQSRYCQQRSSADMPGSPRIDHRKFTSA